MQKHFFWLLLLPIFAQAQQNLIKNGNFEAGNADFMTEYKYIQCKTGKNGCGNGKYMCNGSYALANVAATCNPDWSARVRDHTTAKYGAMLIADFALTPKIIWQQKVAVEAGATYAFQYWAMDISNFGASSAMVWLLDGVPMQRCTPPANTWQAFQGSFTAQKSGNSLISIQNLDVAQVGCDVAIDDISLVKIKDAPKKIAQKVEKTAEKTVQKNATIAPKNATIATIDNATPVEISEATTEIKTQPLLWDAGKATLRPENEPILLALAKTLQQQPRCKLTVASHTDTRGSAKKTTQLSLERSKAVVDFLIAKGVSPDRLTYKGLGATQPIVLCSNAAPCSEAEHQLNRRTEFLITW